MAARRSTKASAPNIPLRLRRRRDGSLALTDASGAVDSASRVFPVDHLFTYAWMLGEDGARVASLEGDALTLTLANATATYQVTERTPQGLLCTLTDASLTDLAPVDEREAQRRAEARSRAEARGEA